MADQIQLVGTLKCRATQKVSRFLKERGIKFHFLDLNQKPLSQGELNNISKSIALEELLDIESKEYKKLNLKFMVFDVEKVLLEYPYLIKTPIIRFKGKAYLESENDALKLIFKDLLH
ncbi:hypothetical protein MASR1M45_00250 [Candidatus Kapaibacterium sp.]